MELSWATHGAAGEREEEAEGNAASPDRPLPFARLSLAPRLRKALGQQPAEPDTSPLFPDRASLCRSSWFKAKAGPTLVAIGAWERLRSAAIKHPDEELFTILAEHATAPVPFDAAQHVDPGDGDEDEDEDEDEGSKKGGKKNTASRQRRLGYVGGLRLKVPVKWQPPSSKKGGAAGRGAAKGSGGGGGNACPLRVWRSVSSRWAAVEVEQVAVDVTPEAAQPAPAEPVPTASAAEDDAQE